MASIHLDVFEEESDVKDGAQNHDEGELDPSSEDHVTA